MTLRTHAVEEVYELMDAIEAGDDHEMAEELGDLLLQVVFHCQLANERGAFDFEQVARRITDKLLRRHPHVFGDVKVKDVDEVWANWEKIKQAEKHGTKHARPSALDGIPKHLPALARAEKLVKKARKANLFSDAPVAADVRRRMATSAGKSALSPRRLRPTRRQLAEQLFALTAHAQTQGWSAEELLREEVKRRELGLRKTERKKA